MVSASRRAGCRYLMLNAPRGSRGDRRAPPRDGRALGDRPRRAGPGRRPCRGRGRRRVGSARPVEGRGRLVDPRAPGRTARREGEFGSTESCRASPRSSATPRARRCRAVRRTERLDGARLELRVTRAQLASARLDASELEALQGSPRRWLPFARRNVRPTSRASKPSPACAAGAPVGSRSRRSGSTCRAGVASYPSSLAMASRACCGWRAWSGSSSSHRVP